MNRIGLQPRAKPHDLSERQRQILELLSQGLTKKDVARHLGLTVPSVNSHVSRAYRKLRVHNITGALAKMPVRVNSSDNALNMKEPCSEGRVPPKRPSAVSLQGIPQEAGSAAFSNRNKVNICPFCGSRSI